MELVHLKQDGKYDEIQNYSSFESKKWNML